MANASEERDDAVPPVPTPKKQPTSLLPAFEPFSSSPALPRPLKRTREAFEERPTYPTPVPTSSTAIFSSSPTRANVSRPQFNHAVSALSERAPLATVPTIELNPEGNPTRLGRSSVSCDFQLSSNRVISRVHVVACYRSAKSSLERDRIDITCTGWNGVKVHCQSNVYDLKKGETFSSDVRDSEIMLDVNDTRVFIQWPEKPHLGPISSDEDESSPSKRQRAMLRHSTPPSPSPAQTRRAPVSPISPSPAVQALLPSSPPVPSIRHPAVPVEIYEDPEAADDARHTSSTAEPSQAPTQILSQSLQVSIESEQALASPSHDFSDNDEENDPIIHSFGPYGANLLPRMASFNATDSPRPKPSPRSSKEPLHSTDSPAQTATYGLDFDIKEHIVNQLAFSRLSSTPLSTILSHLPRNTGILTKASLKDIIEQVDCVGEVTREGKDAAGKALESEYYYVPEKDQDAQRKEAVVNDLMKPGLRACRKQHKQYFWRKPK